MSKITLAGILTATLVVAGCSNNPPSATPPPPPGKANVEVHAPGVDVKVDQGEVKVKAPGADVEVDRKP